MYGSKSLVSSKNRDNTTISALHLTFLERQESHDGPNLCLLFGWDMYSLAGAWCKLTAAKSGDDTGDTEVVEEVEDVSDGGDDDEGALLANKLWWAKVVVAK